VALVRERTISTNRPPLVGEVSANRLISNPSIRDILDERFRQSISVANILCQCLHFIQHVSASYINILSTVDLYINNFVERKVFLFHKTVYITLLVSIIHFFSSSRSDRPPLWSSGHGSLLQIQWTGFDSQRYHIF
jgi:hypothetical protein